MYRLPLRGNFSLRALAALFTAAILTTLFGALLYSQPAAAAPGKAEWQNDNIVYDGKEYQPDSTQNIPGIPAGATVFSRKDEAAGKVSVLYYEQGADTTKETKLKVIEYTLNNDGTYSSPGPPTDATLGEKKANDGNKSQCAIAGVGWIVCQMSRWIATGMDGIFKLIANYLVVQPITTDRDNALFKSWEIARSLANMCFVLAFLMIIYAQITSQGLSNYEIKKMIPKLIVAAVLVNISYYICAIAVDISNILGQGIQQALVDIRKSIPQTGGTTAISWKNFTEYIMSGGAVGAAGLVGLKAYAGGTIAGTFSSLGLMLAPVLVGALIAVLIAVIILAARQALIIVLIVASPLAFVAMLLPNTEKWYEKWKDLLITMLLVFPMFSLLFGGSQLASHIVMGSTDDLSVKLLALFIQAAPLVVTPFLVKFSGSLLGRFAGMMNDPKKGLVDRTRNWATDKAEAKRGQTFKRVANGGGNRFQRYAYNRAKDQKHRDSWKKQGEEWLEAGWENDPRSHRHHKSMAEADVMKNVGKSVSNLEIANMKIKDATISNAIAQTKLNEDKTKNLEARQEAAWQEMRAGKNTHQFGVTPGMMPTAEQLEFGNRVAAQAARESNESRALAQRAAYAQSAQGAQYAKAILDDSDLAVEAGGIGGEMGKMIATARATQDLREDFGKKQAASTELLKHFSRGIDTDHLKILAMGGSGVVGKDSEGRTFTFDASAIGDAMHDAAATKFMQESSAADFQMFMQHVSDNQDAGYSSLNSTVKEIAMKQFSAKLPYVGSKSLDLIDQGKAGSSTTPGEGFIKMVVQTLEGGKNGPEKLVGADPAAIKQYIDVIKRYNNNEEAVVRQVSNGVEFSSEVSTLIDNAREALNDPQLKGSITSAARKALTELSNLNNIS